MDILLDQSGFVRNTHHQISFSHLYISLILRQFNNPAHSAQK